jgi:hypothetical protein
MRIVVDAMGSDAFPRPDVEGAVQAARLYGVEITLVGDEKVVRPALAACDPGSLPIAVMHAPEMLTMHDKGLSLALKAKRREPKTSMALGIDLVKKREAVAFVTAGNTGAAATTAYRLGTLPGLNVGPPVSTTEPASLDVGATRLQTDTFSSPSWGTSTPRRSGVCGPSRAASTAKSRVKLLIRETYPLLAAAGSTASETSGQGSSPECGRCRGQLLQQHLPGAGRQGAHSDIAEDPGIPFVKIGACSCPTLGACRMLDPARKAAPCWGSMACFHRHRRSDALAIQNAVR